MSIGRRIGNGLERTIYVIAGLPIALRGVALAPTPHARIIRRAFAHRYWHPNSISDGVSLASGLLLTPIAVPLAALWFTLRNGPVIRQRDGRGLVAQFIEQLRLYTRAGIVGPWYYILSLHRDGKRRAATFLQRCETKRGVYALVKDDSPTAVGNKSAFADRCAAAGVRAVACEMVIDGGDVDPAQLPDCDLFVKPLTGCGGKGAERWDRVGPRKWSNGNAVVGDSDLVWELRSRRRALVVQRRLQPHPALEPLTSGATPTVRALTILDEGGRPELVATVFRMSIGANRTVDNIHAGGLACAVSLDEGTLELASNLGSDARLGWHSVHPTTGARIEGTRLPFWNEVKALAVKAHKTVEGRIIIGWDIAIAEDGPIVIEGNRGPDMDLMQRFMETGFCGPHRFGELIAHHLVMRGYGLSRRSSARDASRSTARRGAPGTSAR
jgi:glutathione synthase/RimK-type ligase-like ATP-grasp enzyme